MTCKKKQRVLSFFLNELREEEAETFKDHLRTCSECGELLEEFETTERFLKSRPLPKVPTGLEKNCLRRIDLETREWRRESVFEKLFNRLIWRPKPVWRWAVLVFVFCGGFGLGKLVFDDSNWLEKYKRMIRGEVVSGDIHEGRYLHNYLLSVETHFLNLSNMKNPTLLDKEDWKVEMEVTREILRRTRRMKEAVLDGDPDLYQLVTEIEWVLEDVLHTPKLELAGLSKDIRQNIDERRLLTKIHGYIS